MKRVFKKTGNAFQSQLIAAEVKFQEKYFGKLSQQQDYLMKLDWVNNNAKTFRKEWEMVIPHVYIQYNKKGLHGTISAKMDINQLEIFANQMKTENEIAFPDVIYSNIIMEKCKIVEV